jgi:hypothetical protein
MGQVLGGLAPPPDPATLQAQAQAQAQQAAAQDITNRLIEVEGPKRPVLAIASLPPYASHDPSIMILWDSSRDPGPVRVYSSGDGQLLDELQAPGATFLAVYQRPSDRCPRIFIAGNGSLRVFSGDSLALLHVIDMPWQEPIKALFTYQVPGEDRTRIAVGGPVTIFDGETFEPRHQMGEGAFALATHTHGDRQWLLVGVEGHVVVYDAASMKEIHTVGPGWGNLVPVTYVTAWDDVIGDEGEVETYVGTISGQNRAAVWGLVEGRPPRAHYAQNDSCSMAVMTWEEEGQVEHRVAIGGIHGLIQVFDSRMGLVWSLRTHTYAVTHLTAFDSAEGPWRLVSGSADWTCKVCSMTADDAQLLDAAPSHSECIISR